MWGRKTRQQKKARAEAQTAMWISQEIMALTSRPDEADYLERLWRQQPDMLVYVMGWWYTSARQKHGDATMRAVIQHTTGGLGNLSAISHPSSRSVFCDLLYAMQDSDSDKAYMTWLAVRMADEWVIAAEVTGMMAGMFRQLLAPGSS